MARNARVLIGVSCLLIAVAWGLALYATRRRTPDGIEAEHERSRTGDAPQPHPEVARSRHRQPQPTPDRGADGPVRSRRRAPESDGVRSGAPEPETEASLEQFAVFEGLNQRLRMEDASGNWSRETQLQIRSELSVAAGTTIRDVACGQTLCRVHLAHQDSGSRDATLATMFRSPLFTSEFYAYFQGELQTSNETYVFLARPGTSLDRGSFVD